LECYEPTVPLFGLAASFSSSWKDGIVRKYPLGAFLSGMRGLDIGVETCISVNSRGMMAIQHQVSRDGYYDFSEDGGKGKVKPSFVDFIMTCIEDVEDDGDTISQDNGSVEMSQQQQHNGLQDITNEDRSTNVEVGRRKARENVARSRPKRGRAKAVAAARKEEESSAEEEEEEQPVQKAGQKGEHYDDDEAESNGDIVGNDGDVDFNDEHAHRNAQEDHNATKPSPKRPSNNDTSRILEELEVDQDMVSSHRKGGAAAVGQGRKNALEDLRRRRQEQRQLRQSLDYRKDDKMQKSDEHSDDDNDGSDHGKHENRRKKRSNNSTSGRKRRSTDSSKAAAAPRKGARRRSEEAVVDCDNSDSNPSEDDHDTTNTTNGQSSTSSKQRHHHSNPAQDSQSEDDDDDGDETELEDSLDVTAEIPQLFSKRSSLSTSRHGRSSRGSHGRDRGSMDGNGGDHSEEEVEQEPRMMYGDTKLEFTQDGYGSDGSF